MVVFADKCPYLEFHVVDINEEKIKLWNQKGIKKLPVYEPGLDKLVKKCRG